MSTVQEITKSLKDAKSPIARDLERLVTEEVYLAITEKFGRGWMIEEVEYLRARKLWAFTVRLPWGSVEEITLTDLTVEQFRFPMIDIDSRGQSHIITARQPVMERIRREHRAARKHYEDKERQESDGMASLLEHREV